MAAYLDSSVSDLLRVPRGGNAGPRKWRNVQTGKPLRIAVVNNMPDGALVATERQFCGLVENATAGQALIDLYFLPGLGRGAEAQMVLDARYQPVTELYRRGADAVIVTGNEPRAAKLNEEPYWPELTALIDWAAEHTTSTLFSCLAAHAAVLHLDGIERRRLAAKRSGVFACKVSPGIALSLSGTLSICHSRLNEVPKRELIRHGYTIISETPGGHVDAFTKSWSSTFLFLQGHPEYAPDSLMREYRRDVGRYLAGQRHDYPGIPENYFDAPSVRALQSFRATAERSPSPSLLNAFPAVAVRHGLQQRLARSAAAVFAMWLGNLADTLAAA